MEIPISAVLYCLFLFTFAILCATETGVRIPEHQNHYEGAVVKGVTFWMVLEKSVEEDHWSIYGGKDKVQLQRSKILGSLEDRYMFIATKTGVANTISARYAHKTWYGKTWDDSKRKTITMTVVDPWKSEIDLREDGSAAVVRRGGLRTVSDMYFLTHNVNHVIRVFLPFYGSAAWTIEPVSSSFRFSQFTADIENNRVYVDVTPVVIGEVNVTCVWRHDKTSLSWNPLRNGLRMDTIHKTLKLKVFNGMGDL